LDQLERKAIPGSCQLFPVEPGVEEIAPMVEEPGSEEPAILAPEVKNLWRLTSH